MRPNAALPSAALPSAAYRLRSEIRARRPLLATLREEGGIYARAMPPNVVHFAIHADDVERARGFYEAVFAWRFEAWGPPGFYDVTTGDDDHPGIRGALHGRSEALTGTGTSGFTCTVAVDDLEAIRTRVVAAGGTIVLEEMEIPTVGRLTQFLDTEGNEVAAMVYAEDPFGG